MWCFDNTCKYVKVKGSRQALFGAENLIGVDVGLFCEGEFDSDDHRPGIR